ncbi:MAG TPA: acyl carrier protein [Myxococcota bacterium]|nr:acyl carrier protein [Myxococcota bacterium]
MTWTHDSLRAELARIGREQLGWREVPDGDLAAALDSVDRLALVVAIEDRFQIAFDPDDDARIHTLDDVIALVLDRLTRSTNDG